MPLASNILKCIIIKVVSAKSIIRQIIRKNQRRLPTRQDAQFAQDTPFKFLSTQLTETCVYLMNNML